MAFSADSGTRRVNVAIISNSLPPYKLAQHRRIVNVLPEVRLWSLFTHEVSNAGWQFSPPADIQPVCFGGTDERSADQSKLHRQLREWAKGGRITKWLTRNSIDLVILCGYNDFGRIRVIHSCHKARIPCFLFGDSNILADTASPLKALLKQVLLPKVLSRCTGILHCGSLGRQYFQRYGVPVNALKPFPYEPDYAEFEVPSQARIDSMRQKHHLASNRRYFLYCGRLAQEKRVDLLLRAFVSVSQRYPEWDLVIAGDGPERHALTQLVPDFCLQRVHWIGFLNSTGDIAALHRCCDVFVLPSDREPWGVALTEAATSMALLCSDAVGAGKDILVNGENGYLFRAGDLASLIQATASVCSRQDIDAMRAQSPRILNRWRSEHDSLDCIRWCLSFLHPPPPKESGFLKDDVSSTLP